MFGYIILALVLLVVFYVIGQHNWFQTTFTRIIASIQEIGNQLKRQSDLIPNLESSAKGYLKHEKGIFKDLTDARKAVQAAAGSTDLAKITKASDMVSSLVPKLQIVVESNPEIKGAQVVTQLMDELRDTSDKIMYSRRLVIDLSADYNARRITFPSNLVANTFGFQQQKGLETPMSGGHVSVSEGETKTPKISL